METDKVLRVIEEAARNNQTRLNLSKNQLKTLPAEIGKLKNLTRLILSRNQLTSLPVEIVELKTLTWLDLSNNQLTSLPAEIVELKNLTGLDLSENKLTSLPAEIVELKTLTGLDLAENKLKTLPAEIVELKNLNTLYLSGNQLKTLPAEIGKLKNLTRLILSRNQLKTLPAEIVELKNLNTLDLAGNQLKTLPAEIVELKNLNTLYLSGNQLKTLPAEIVELKNLNTLYLYENQLKTLPAEVGKLKNLTRLILSRNQLTSLPAEIVELKNLTWLDLAENQLKTLPAEIVELKNLTWLELSVNPLEFPPQDITNKGIKAIRSYFKSLKGERRALNEVKVLLVGDGGAGKTSLVKQLLGEEFDKDEPQTHGMNLRDWKLEDILVHFWDFGGQEIMHATHQFFLSKRSLYILVLDGRRDEKTEYWLKHIESFGGDSPILVVLNKIDKNPSFEVNRKFLQEKYKGITGFYRVSCAEGQGIKDFTEALSKALANVELIETTWATSWFNVKTQLEEMTENFISIDEYKEMCTKEGITSKSSQDVLMDFLNDLGVILHFNDFELLDTFVLDPKWVTDAVYRIINSKELATCNGVLKRGLLDEILKKEEDADYYYPPEKYRYIIDLMKKFEFCYEIDRETVLLPDLLEVQEPEFNFDYDAALKFVIDYDFLPKSIMPRFIVKMHKDIKNKLHWRTGVVLEAKAFHSTAVIKADERDEKIYIYVDGEQKRDYFSAILFTFRKINRSFEKLKAIEKVPLPDEPEITVSYEHLVRLEKKGIELYIPDGSAREYKVKDLLGTIYVEKKTEEEILEILRKLKDKSDTEETLLQKAEDIAILQPNFMGVGVDVKKLVDSIMQRPTLDEQKEIIKLNNPKNIPPDIENIHNRALIFERDGNYREAIREYKKIIDINEFFLMAWQGLERNYRHLGEKENILVALGKINSIIDAIDFGTNVEQNIILNQLELYNLDFFDDLIWTFQPQINILLGKNGYGKTYLLKLMVSLLQNDYGVSSVFFSGEKRNAYTKLHLDINNDTKIIQRSKAVFEESIGRVPLLAIPDSRFIDKSKITVSYSDSEKGNLREVGSLKFLDERPFEAIIQKFLFYLCVTFMNEGKSFKIPIFPFIQKVVRELSDNEFEFYKIEPIVGELEFKIEVITEGNKDKPLPIQKASQGTLSVLAIFGVIYYYLKSVFQDTPEEELLKKPAIVFIDEVDAHLHPSWQQRIIGLLRKNFPNVQFVVTAHSPLVVAGCYENEVAVLRKGKGGFTVEQCEDSFVGSTTNDLYERIFEIEDIDEKYLYYATLYSMKLDNSDKINELEAKSTLSAAEQEELDRLFKEDYNVSRIAEIKMEEEEKENIYEKEINDLQEEIKGLKSKLKKESRE